MSFKKEDENEKIIFKDFLLAGCYDINIICNCENDLAKIFLIC